MARRQFDYTRELARLRFRLRSRIQVLVAKILSGFRPGDLPIEQARKLALVINFRTAKSRGTLLSLADEAIE